MLVGTWSLWPMTSLRTVPKTSALRVIQDVLNFARPTTLTTFGYADGDQMAKSSKKWPKVGCCIRCDNAEQVRVPTSPCSETRDENV